MITIYKTIAGKWRILDEVEKDTWIHVSDPTEDEKELLQQNFGIPAGLIRDSLDEDERARVRKMEDLVFMIVRCSRRRKEDQDQYPFDTVPLGIFYFEDKFITLCQSNPDAIRDIILGTVRNISTQERATFLLLLFLHVGDIIGGQLREIHRKSTLEEEELKKEITGKRINVMLNYGKSLIFLTSSIKTNDKMLNKFKDLGYVDLNAQEKRLLEDVILQSGENAEIADVFEEIHEGMMEAFSNLVSINLNAIVRILTEITIAFAIPAVIVGAWGMQHMPVPFEDNPNAFWIVTGIMIAFTVLAFVIIRVAELLSPGMQE